SAISPVSAAERVVLSRAGDGRARAHARERARLHRGPPRLGRLRALAPAALRRPRRARGCVVSGRRRYRRPAGCDPKQRRRRRPVRHHLAIRTELLHREQPGGRWHLSVAALRERRTRIRAPGCHRTGGDRARPAADAGGGLKLLDRQGAGLHHVTPRGLADVDGPEGRAAVERDRDARHREPGGARRMVVAVAHRRRDRALRRAGTARAVRRHRDVDGAAAAVDPLCDDAGLRRERRAVLCVRALPISPRPVPDPVRRGRHGGTSGTDARSLNSEAYYPPATLLAAGDQPVEAVDHFRRALATVSASADVHYYLGIALVGQGKVEEGIAEFRAALQIDPGSAKSHRNLADALASARR